MLLYLSLITVVPLCNYMLRDSCQMLARQPCGSTFPVMVGQALDQPVSMY